jgi:hypothetical protein
VVPDSPSYAMEGGHWRDATSIRLAVPLPYLALAPPACCCHDRFGQRSGSLLDSLRCARGYRSFRINSEDVGGAESGSDDWSTGHEKTDRH